MPPPRPVLTTYADPAQLEAWLAAAAPGDMVTYACGPALGKCPAQTMMREAQEAGLVQLSRQRAAYRPGCWEYQARRRAAIPQLHIAGPGPAQPFSTIWLRSPAGRLYAALADCAARGAACPTNDEMAWLAGLKSHHAASYRLGQLAEQGLLRIVAAPKFGARVIEIVATGQRTGGAK